MCRIAVTDHAVEQYRAKYLHFTQKRMSNDEIREKLASIVELGQRVRSLPGKATEYEYKKFFVTATLNQSDIVILTYNGDHVWRCWWRQQEVRAKGR